MSVGGPEPALPLVTILMPCFNEEGNVREVYLRVKLEMESLPGYDYDHLFIDNSSTDGTVSILRELAAADKRVKVIVNTRNFGHIRSPFHGFLQARGDAVMSCVADLQDPPELIPQFVRKWEQGYKVVIGVKAGSRESWLMSRTRKLYYRLVGRLSSDVELVHNFTGFGLYDREVIELFRSTDEQYPYFRGLVSDFGYERAEIQYVQPARKSGRTKIEERTGFAGAAKAEARDEYEARRCRAERGAETIDGIELGRSDAHAWLPVEEIAHGDRRLATMAGFAISVVSLLVAIGYLVAKLMFWNELQLGLAPLLIGIYFFGAVQLFFIGVLGEYIGAIHTQVHKRPLVVEKERINFD